MLHIHLALIKATTVSALSLQLIQPLAPELDSTTDIVLPSSPQAATNASHLTNSSGALTGQWDGTIALPFNEPNRSISYPLLNDPSQSENNTSISTFNKSSVSGPKPKPNLPPFPRGWQLRCSERRGVLMSPSSCLEAWTLIPPIERPISFGPRTATNTYDVGLPRRYLSSDGTCAIEPELVSGATEAYVKPSDAGIATAYVIRHCVGEKSQGGYTQNSRGNNDLGVSVARFLPRVECSWMSSPPDPTILKACEAIVDQMKTSKGKEMFAQDGIHDPDLENPLPFYLSAPAEAPQCVLRVMGRQRRQYGHWYQIWEAAVAINAMCIRQGRAGRWDGLGTEHSLAVEIARVGRPASSE